MAGSPPKSHYHFVLSGVLYLPKCWRSHQKKLDTLQKVKGILIQKICNSIQGHTSHFSFHGTFLNLKQHKMYLWKKSGSACLNISIVFAKGKKMFIFSYFGPCLYLHILEIKIFCILFCLMRFPDSFNCSFLSVFVLKATLYSPPEWFK